MIEAFYIIPRIGGIAYLNNPKAACSSVLVALAQMRVDNEFEPPKELLPDGSHPIHGFHPPYSQLEYFFSRWPLIYPPIPDSLIKFSFVRDPYERFESFYRSKILLGQAPGLYYERFGIKQGCSFEECVEKITSVDPKELEHHAAPQTMLLCKDGELLVDFVGKVEEFQEDWLVIENLTGFNRKLEHINVTRSSGRTAYSDKTRQQIYSYYRTDFELFGYKGNTEQTHSEPSDCDAGGVCTVNKYSPAEIEDLKRQLAVSSDRIRSLARTFAEDSKKRDEFFEHQREPFRELMLKRAFYIETKLKESISSQLTFHDMHSRSLVKLAGNLEKVQGEHKIFEGRFARIQEDHESFEGRLAQIEQDLERLSKRRLTAEKRWQRHVLATFKHARSNPILRLFRFLRSPLLSEVKILRKYGMVDVYYYFRAYPQTIDAGITAIEHYVRYGASQGMHPSADFDTVQYLIDHPDATYRGINPLVHSILNREHAKP